MPCFVKKNFVDIKKICVDKTFLTTYYKGMPERSSKKKNDINLIAKSIVEQLEGEGLTIEDGKNPAAVLLGRLGGLKGGKARAAKLSAEERSDIAKKAAQKRWHKDSTT